MFKQLVTGSALGLVLLSGAAQAIEGSVDVGEHNTNLNVGLGTTSPGLFLQGFAVALGGGAQYSFNSMWGLYGEYYYAPEGLTDHLDSYQEAAGGLSFTPISLLNLRVGYQYIELNNKGGRKDNVLVDGPYVGASLRF